MSRLSGPRSQDVSGAAAVGTSCDMPAGLDDGQDVLRFAESTAALQEFLRQALGVTGALLFEVREIQSMED